MFRIEMLPAGHGDCLLIEYGDRADPHRILIDGGIATTYKVLRARIESLPKEKRKFELLIVTHIDADHIEGAIKLLGGTRTLSVSFGDVWFNGWKHLLPGDSDDEWLSGRQGEFLSALITEGGHPWNQAFGGNTVVVPDDGPLPVRRLPGGMTLTLLSPTTAQLERLYPKWDQEVRKAGLDRDSVEEVLSSLNANRTLRPEDALLDDDDELLGGESIDVERLAGKEFVPDSAEANGSSIAVLAEFEGRRCLLTGDSFASTLCATIGRLLKQSGAAKLKLDALKLAHHGSRANTNSALLRMLRCRRYLFSTNGNIFHHPDREGVARVIAHGGRNSTLFFNYRTDFNAVWDDSELKSRHAYRVRYAGGRNGCGIEL